MNSEFIFCRGFRVDLVIALCYTMCDAVLHEVCNSLVITLGQTGCVIHWVSLCDTRYFTHCVTLLSMKRVGNSKDFFRNPIGH